MQPALEWCIPLQKLDITKVHLGPLTSRLNREKKPMALLSYKDAHVVMPIVTVLLPHLVIDNYNATNGRLDLVLDASWMSEKFTTLQNSLLHMIGSNQLNWFGMNQYSMEELQRFFQPMVEGGILHLYCPTLLQDKRKGVGAIRVWKEGSWIDGVRPGLLVKGEKIRVALQIQGMSLQLGNMDSNWTGRSRLQHRVLAILLQPPKTPECLIEESHETC